MVEGEKTPAEPQRLDLDNRGQREGIQPSKTTMFVEPETNNGLNIRLGPPSERNTLSYGAAYSTVLP